MDMLESNTIQSFAKDNDLFTSKGSPKVYEGYEQRPRIQDMNAIFDSLIKEAKTDRNMALEIYFFLLMGKSDDETLVDIKLLLLNEYKIPKRYLSHIDRLVPFYRS
jgi:hypothetical protein